MDYHAAFESVLKKLCVAMKNELVEACKESFNTKIHETVDKANAIVENAPKPHSKKVYQDIFATIKKMSCDFSNNAVDKIISKHFRTIDTNISQVYEMLRESQQKMEDIAYTNNMCQVRITQLETENAKLKEESEEYKKKYLEEVSKFRINADKLKILIEESKNKQ
jgi:uncharacterized phage infection (PIP) family protein YhgE